MAEAAWTPSAAPAGPRRRRPLLGRMPLVELVLEMLWAALPSFEFDAEAWGLPERRERPPSPPPCLPVDPALQRFYLDLGVRLGADLDEVHAAWRRLVREHHPDLFGGDPERQRRGGERLKDLNRAYLEIRRRVLGGGG